MGHQKKKRVKYKIIITDNMCLLHVGLVYLLICSGVLYIGLHKSHFPIGPYGEFTMTNGMVLILTFSRDYLYFLLLTFSKQPCYSYFIYVVFIVYKQSEFDCDWLRSINIHHSILSPLHVTNHVTRKQACFEVRIEAAVSRCRLHTLHETHVHAQ